MMSVVRLGLLVLVGCGRVAFDERAVDGAMGDGAAATCERGPWKDVTRQLALVTPNNDWEPAISPDGLEVVYGLSLPPTSSRLMFSVRGSRTATFDPPVEIVGLGNQPYAPSWSPDGTKLYYRTLDDDVSHVARYLGGGQFSDVQLIEVAPACQNFVLTRDENEIFCTTYVATTEARVGWFERAGLGAPWIAQVLPAGVNEMAGNTFNGWPGFDEGRQDLYWERHEDPDSAIYVVHRESADAPFGAPRKVTELGAAADPDVSADGFTMVLSVSGPDGYDVATATRDCL